MSPFGYTDKVLEKSFDIRVYRTKNGVSPFKRWLAGIEDRNSLYVINERISRMRLGHFGNYRDLKDGVFELKIPYGPGFRVYFSVAGKKLILLLIGGNKSSQKRDIEQAKEYWNEFKKSRTDHR